MFILWTYTHIHICTYTNLNVHFFAEKKLTMGFGRSTDRTKIWFVPIEEFSPHWFDDHVFKFISIKFHINCRWCWLSVSRFDAVISFLWDYKWNNNCTNRFCNRLDAKFLNVRIIQLNRSLRPHGLAKQFLITDRSLTNVNDTNHYPILLPGSMKPIVPLFSTPALKKNVSLPK